MEILGYLHTAIEFEEPTPDRVSCEHDECKDHGRSPDSPRASRSWVNASSLCLSALVCSLSIVIGTAPTASAMMRFGDSGTGVTLLQEELAEIGFFNGPMTGYFGEITQAAVRQLQRANGLVDDGIVGPATQAALRTYKPVYTTAIATAPTTIAPVQSSVIQMSPIQELAFGSSGPSVTQLQTQLTRLGVYSGPITGFYGTQTRAAVMRFQQLNGLVSTGIADSSTIAMLNSAVVVVEPVEVVTVMPTPTVVARPAVQPTVVQQVTVPVRQVNRAPLTPPSNISASSQILYRGDSGQAVLQLQQALTATGIYKGPITGYYGALTEDAVASFQQLNGIEPNGVTGPITWQALRDTTEVM